MRVIKNKGKIYIVPESPEEGEMLYIHMKDGCFIGCWHGAKKYIYRVEIDPENLPEEELDYSDVEDSDGFWCTWKI